MKKIYFEVGANQGQDTEKFLTEDVTLYCFEPIPEMAFILYQKFGKNPNFNLITGAVDIENGFKKFNISKGGDWGCSSLHNFAPDLHTKWHRSDFVFDDLVEKMMCIRLDSFLDLYNIPHIDYIHIDAQGNDFNVLKSLGDKIELVKAGVVEVAQKVELYDIKDNHLSIVKPWLEERGFKIRIEDDGVGKPGATINGNEVNLFFTR
jgi:FkbM family methyltransferase